MLDVVNFLKASGYKKHLPHALGASISPDDLLQNILIRVSRGEDIRLFSYEIAKKNFAELKEAFHFATIYAAVKANSIHGLLKILDESGSKFEVASLGELHLCRQYGIKSENIIFTHTAKDSLEIREAYYFGVRDFVTDSKEDIECIANCIREEVRKSPKPGTQVPRIMVRIDAGNKGKEDDKIKGLSGRFGCTPEAALELLKLTKELKLEPVGISFHVGTQEESVHAWDKGIERAAGVFKEAEKAGIKLHTLDIGGGFPSRYKDSIPEPKAYATAIDAALTKHFNDAGIQRPLHIALEPGRSIAAMAGMTIGRVVQVKNNPDADIVTVSTGRFSAGIWGVGHAVRFYGSPTGVKGKGGTRSAHLLPCDETNGRWADIYGKAGANFDRPFEVEQKKGEPVKHDLLIPAGLKSGHFINTLGTGAYTGEMGAPWCQQFPPTDIIIGKTPQGACDILHEIPHGPVHYPSSLKHISTSLLDKAELAQTMDRMSLWSK